MNIIIEKEKNGRIKDGINTILELKNDEFDYLINEMKPKKDKLESIKFYYLTDKCESPKNKVQLGVEKLRDASENYIGRGYFGGNQISTNELLKNIEKEMLGFPKDSTEYKRAKELLSTRDMKSFLFMYINNENKDIIYKIAEILENDTAFQKFLDYENNIEYFSIDSKTVEKKDYLKFFGEFFGKKDENGELTKDNSINKNFYIKNIENYNKKYSLIYDNNNIERFVDKKYDFQITDDWLDTIIRKNEEVWKISDKLREKIYENMPNNLNIEEKAIYIYAKMCKEFRYDEGYFYRFKLPKDGRYDNDFSKERLENIDTNSKITCFDFTRIYAKFINELEGDIEAVVIGKGSNDGHFTNGLYTDKISVEIEPINGMSFGTNDLMKAKKGIMFEGFKVISDRYGILNSTVQKIYSEVVKKELISINQYMREIRKMVGINSNSKTSLKGRLNSFINTMKEDNINGNEAVQIFNTYYFCGFFGSNLERIFLGEKYKIGNKESFKRLVALRNRDNEKGLMYLIDTEKMELNSCETLELLNKLNSHEYVYEDQMHTFEDLDR